MLLGRNRLAHDEFVSHLVSKTYWFMSDLVVHMDKSPFHIRETLELNLQVLGNVVRKPQRCIRVHHHINLDEKTRP